MEFLFFRKLHKHMLWNPQCSSINVEVTKCSKEQRYYRADSSLLFIMLYSCSHLYHEFKAWTQTVTDKNSALCIKEHPATFSKAFSFISKKNVFKHKSYFSKPLPVPKHSPRRQITLHPTRRNDAPPIACSVPCFVCLRVLRSDPAPEKKQSQRLVILRAESWSQATGGSRSTGLKQHGWETYQSILSFNHHT